MRRPADSNGGKVATLAWWLLLALFCLIVLVLRIHRLSFPLERDEGEYAYAGQLMLEGIPPYKLAYNMKFPGTYVAYALLMAITGQTTAGIHLGLLFVNAATSALIFFLTRRLTANLKAAIAATVGYAVMSVSPDFYGFSAHATQFIAPIVTGALLLLLRATERKAWSLVLASGVGFGLAVIMKQPAIVFGIFGLAYLLLSDFRQRLSKRDILGRGLTFAGGMVIPLGLTLLWLWRSGVFPKFWLWTVQYASAYGNLVPFSAVPSVLSTRFNEILPTHWPLLLVATFGLIAVLLNGSWNRRLFNGGFVVASIIALSAGLYFRPHYFVFVLPAVAVLIGEAIDWSERLLNGRSSLLECVPLVLLVAFFSWSIIDERDLLWKLRPEIASKWIYNDAPFPETVVVADYIREHSEARDTVAVIGSEPQIYFLSHRHSATGYIYTYALMEAQKYAPAMQKEMLQEIEAARPRFIVNVAIATSWNARPDSDLSILTTIDQYVAQNYAVVGLVNIGEQETQFDFDHPDLAKAWPTGLVVYERQSTPAPGL